MFRSVTFFSIALALCGGKILAAPTPEAKATVVVFNLGDPTSKSLALYYQQKRGIPAENLVGLSCSQGETISRAEYNTTIAFPLKKVFRERGWWKVGNGRVTDTKIRFVALIRGMPLRISPEPRPPGDNTPVAPLSRDEASVDSELAVMGFGDLPLPGPVKNPYLNSMVPIVDSYLEPGLLLVCRLDAVTDITVRAMIDDAIATEKSGLWGWAYIDSRGLTDGPYLEGDQWLTTAANELRAKGVPVLWDKAPETLPVGYPVTDAAVYYGWYDGNVSGPFSEPAMRFKPGAIAVHLHSFSASTLRNPALHWAGPLLEHGAAATLGNVFEPYLSLTTHFDIFQQRLMAGFTFAESAYIGTIGLSWMTVAIGDPLYRPYAAWQSPIAPSKPNIWQKYRTIVLNADGNVTAAAPALRAATVDTGDSMFLEALGACQADASDLTGALESINTALTLRNKPMVAFRLNLEKLGVLRALGRMDEAKALVIGADMVPPTASEALLLERLRSQYLPPATSSQK